MNDNINAFIVVLNKDISEEHSKKVLNAIRMISGVLDVTSHISDINPYTADECPRCQ